MTKTELVKVEHNRKTVLSILNGKPNKEIFEGYQILKGDELKENKKYHILTKILDNGLFEGLGSYEDWIFNTQEKSEQYKGIEGITEGYRTEKISYNFRLNYDDIFIIKEYIIITERRLQHYDSISNMDILEGIL